MGLVEPIGGRGSLGQGDLLRDLAFYGAAIDGTPEQVSEAVAGLVISRNCNALRASHVLVAPVVSYRRETFAQLRDGAVSMDRARRLMAGLRDGWNEPDIFYLGPIQALGHERYAANLRHICSFGVPVADAERASWVEGKRVARLSTSHRRHLHARLFRAFADEGFDDFSWWPTQDLNLIVAKGRQEIADAQRQLAAAEISLETGRSDGSVEPKQLQRALSGRQAKIGTARLDLEKAQAALRPYLDELARRETAE